MYVCGPVGLQHPDLWCYLWIIIRYICKFNLALVFRGAQGNYHYYSFRATILSRVIHPHTQYLILIILKYFLPFLQPTDTEYLKLIFPNRLKESVFHICYNRIGQKISICDYWKGKGEV